MRDPAPRRWSFLLPLLFTAAALLLLAFGRTTATALAERRELAIEGAASRLAHEVERTLRDAEGPIDPGALLAEALASAPELAVGLALLDATGAEETRAGQLPDGGATLQFDLVIPRAGWGGARGPAGPGSAAAGIVAPGATAGIWEPGGWRGGWTRRGPGRRTLVVMLAPGAAAPSRVERAALPVAAVAAGALVALALLAGLLLDRQARALRLAAERERLDGLARAGAGLAHQLRNPLATIRGSAQLLLESCSGPEAARLGAIVSESDRLGRLVDGLLDYARPPLAQPEPIDLAGFRPDRDPARVDWQVGVGATVLADPEHLRLILDNLLDNALEADSERIEVRARRRRNGIELSFLDRGPGPGPDPEQLFEPYVTSKASGTGLGLPLARSLAVANGGSLRLVPRADSGTEALLWLPAAEESG